MKVLNVLNFFDKDTGGGIANRIYQLTNYLNQENISCDILTTNVGKNKYTYTPDKNIKVHYLDTYVKRFFIPSGSFKWLTKNIDSYDIIHLSGNWSILCIIVFYFSLWKNKKIIFSSMGWLSIQGNSKFLKFLFNTIFIKKLIKKANLLIAISPREIKEFVNMGGQEEKIILIPNGVTLNEFVHKDDNLFRKKYNLDERKIILKIGRICEIKGTDLLIDAIEILKDKLEEYQICIFGQDDNGYLKIIKDTIKEKKLDKLIKIFPPILGQDKSMAYNASDFILIPSRFDTMTIVALEAGASSCPVIYTEDCDFNELEQKNSGIMVTKDSDCIAKAILEFKNDEEKRLIYSSNIKKLVMEKYTWETVGKKFKETLFTL
jgi:glycosyltransferase involved in cell wall biosynthesis